MTDKDFKIVRVAGTVQKNELYRYLNKGIVDAGLTAVTITGSAGAESPEEAAGRNLPDGDCRVILEMERGDSHFPADISIFITDRPLEKLDPETARACSNVDVVLIEWGVEFESESELGIERKIKRSTGAGKVLIFHDDESRNHNYRKMLDKIIAKTGGCAMPDDIPEEVIAALKEAAKDNKIGCAAAHKIAHDLGVPIPLVGRALDLLNIKISKCQLGCF